MAQEGSNMVWEGCNMAWEGSNIAWEGSNMALEGSNIPRLKLYACWGFGEQTFHIVFSQRCVGGLAKRLLLPFCGQPCRRRLFRLA